MAAAIARRLGPRWGRRRRAVARLSLPRRGGPVPAPRGARGAPAPLLASPARYARALAWSLGQGRAVSGYALVIFFRLARDAAPAAWVSIGSDADTSSDVIGQNAYGRFAILGYHIERCCSPSLPRVSSPTDTPLRGGRGVPRGSAPRTPHGAPAPCAPPGLFATDPAKIHCKRWKCFYISPSAIFRFAYGDFTFRLRRFFFLSIWGLRPLFVLRSLPFVLNYYKTCLQPLSGWSPEKLT